MGDGVSKKENGRVLRTNRNLWVPETSAKFQTQEILDEVPQMKLPKLGPSFAHNFSQRRAAELKISTLLVQPSVQLLPPATWSQTDENAPAN